MSSKLLSAMVVLIACVAVPAFGQAPPAGGGQGGPGGGAGGPGGGQGGPGGRPDFAQMRKMFEDRMKQQLELTDEQWTALQPKIEKVQQLQRDAQGRGMFGFGRGPGGPGGQGGQDQQLSPVQEKVKALQDAVASPDATPDDVKAKLDALRQAKAKAREDLAKAQDDLRAAINLKQEAMFVVMGMLD